MAKLKAGSSSDGGGAPEETVSLSVSRDAVLSSVRDSHISAVSPFLCAKAKLLKEGRERGESSMSNVQDMKRFVSEELRTLKLQHKSLELHVGASELIMEYSKNLKMSKRLEAEHCLLEGVNQVCSRVDFVLVSRLFR